MDVNLSGMQSNDTVLKYTLSSDARETIEMNSLINHLRFENSNRRWKKKLN